jgi:hypothetical protein
MPVQQGFELPPEEQIDPCEQDGRHSANLAVFPRKIEICQADFDPARPLKRRFAPATDHRQPLRPRASKIRLM